MGALSLTISETANDGIILDIDGDGLISGSTAPFDTTHFLVFGTVSVTILGASAFIRMPLPRIEVFLLPILQLLLIQRELYHIVSRWNPSVDGGRLDLFINGVLSDHLHFSESQARKSAR